MFIPAPGVLRVEIDWTQGTARMTNQLHFGSDTPGLWDPGYIDNVLSYLTGHLWGLSLRPITSRDIYLTQVVATDLTSQEGLRVTLRVDSVLGRGNYPGPAVPPNATLAIKFDTDRRRQGGSGRFYPVGIPAARVVGSTCSPVYAAALVAALIDLRDTLHVTAPGKYLAVYSRYENRARRDQGVALPITRIYYTDLNFDSQRNRLAGHRATKRK